MSKRNPKPKTNRNRNPPPVRGGNSATQASKPPLTWRDRFEQIKIFREFVTVAAAVLALFISFNSSRTANKSLALSQQQSEANSRYHQEHVKPDVHAMVRHSSSSAYRNHDFAAELVVWNNGPIKAISLTASYRVYSFDPSSSHVYASVGVSEPLVDYSFSLPEFKPAQQHVKEIVSGGSPTLYVVNFTYYRETDIERYSSENYFLFENGKFYDRDSFRGRTNYNALMDSLLWKMKCEAMGGSNMYRIADPPLPGTSHVNFNLSNVPEADSPEWTSIISNKTEKVAANPLNPEVYVRRGTSYHLMRKFKEASLDYEHAIDLGSTDFGCYQNLATIRATSTNSALRNGSEAVKLANRACELTGWKNWGCLSAFSAALAETGDFSGAQKYARQVIATPELLPLQREVEERALLRLVNRLPVREGL